MNFFLWSHKIVKRFYYLNGDLGPDKFLDELPRSPLKGLSAYIWGTELHKGANRMIPSIETCLYLMDKYEMLDNIKAHSMLVAKIARLISRGLRDSGLDISVEKTTASKKDIVYHGNIRSRKFHRPECRYYNCKNCTAVFNIRQDAIKAGYIPCKVCKPWILMISKNSSFATCIHQSE